MPKARRCSGRRPEGPGAERAAKWTPEAKAVADGVGRSEGEEEGGSDGEGGGGEEAEEAAEGGGAAAEEGGRWAGGAGEGRRRMSSAQVRERGRDWDSRSESGEAPRDEEEDGGLGMRRRAHSRASAEE